jgi:hypothetical protein
MPSDPNPGSRHEHERHYERAADPAEAADRPLEPKSEPHELAAEDIPEDQPERGEDPHHALNTPVGDLDPAADSDPYRHPTPDDEDDHASGVRGAGQGVQDP